VWQRAKLPSMGDSVTFVDLYKDGGGCIFIPILLYAFLGMSILCDDYMLIALETLVKRWKIRKDVAGASFMALGCAAPEIAINMISVGVGDSAVDVGLSAIVGSGLIAFSLIPAVCTLAATANDSDAFLHLNVSSMIREVVFYVVAVCTLLYFLRDSTIELWEASVLFGMYGVFLLTLFVATPRLPEYEALQEEAVQNGQDSDTQDSGAEEAVQNGEDSDHDSVIFTNIIDALSVPWVLLFNCTMPPSFIKSEKYFWLGLVISFSWVAALSWVIVTSISQLAIGIHLSHAVMGVTVVAFGAEVPDTISSVAAAKAGEGSMALANCMGSQITNILVGLGLPYLISNLCGRLVKIPTGHVTILVNSLAFIVLSMITIFCGHLCWQRKPVLSRPSAFVLVGLYTAAVVYDIDMVH